MVTWISISVIAVAFAIHVWLIIRLERIRKDVESFQLDDASGKIQHLAEEYKANLSTFSNKQETNVPAAYVFNEVGICACYKFNARRLDAAAGTLVGLGLLGTFLGLTLGIRGFDDSSADTIQQSIQTLLGGMATAFVTSLVGMGLSLVYTALEKPARNKLARAIDALCHRLDSEYYVDDTAMLQRHISLHAAGQVGAVSTAMQSMEQRMTQMKESLLSVLRTALTYEKEDGEQIPTINLLRELLRESTEQSRALKSFSTDLAIELNNGFDEMLSRQLQARLIPLMENIDATTRKVMDNIDTTTQTMVEHIDHVADHMAAPVSDMMTSTTDGLKECLQGIMSDFKSAITNNTMQELENMTVMLSGASGAMQEFPSTMQRVTQSMEQTIGEMRQAVNEMATGSVSANEQQLQRTQSIMESAMAGMNTMMARMQQTMDDMTTTQQMSGEAITANMSRASQDMQQQMASSMNGITAQIEQTMQQMVASISDRQTDMMALHEGGIDKLQSLLHQFDDSVQQMLRLNEAAGASITSLQQSQSAIVTASGNMQNVSEMIRVASTSLQQSQADYQKGVAEAGKNTQQTIGSLNEMMTRTGEMSKEYIEQFDTLNNGIEQVFAKLKEGLNEYSAKVRETTKKYLDDYSTALTNTVEQISNTVGELKDIADSLEDTASKMKR